MRIGAFYARTLTRIVAILAIVALRRLWVLYLFVLAGWQIPRKRGRHRRGADVCARFAL